jgi:tetratricopeptide (TPR) repeat protein
MLQSSHGSSRQTRLMRAMLGLLVLLVIVGVASGGAYVYLRLSGSSNSSIPVEQLGSARVEPSLALATLADVGDAEVVNTSLVQGELETAYATILFSTQLTDKERIGNLLLLGQEYEAAGDRSRAQTCYQQASLISTMGPTLSDFGRASNFIQIGESFAEWGSRKEALFNYDQVFALALHSPFIKDPHRADILGQLAEEYDSIGEREKAAESRELQAEVLYSTEESEAAPEVIPDQPIANFLTQIPAPDAAMVASYEDRRVEVVRELLDFLQDSPNGEAMPEELALEATQALVNEDKARSTAYEDELASASSMVLRIGIAEARVDWLLIKYRMALGAYGLQLVPAWSDDVEGIAAELAEAHGELHDIYGEQIATFADETAMDRAWYDVLRLEMLRGSLGLYPNYPEAELISELTEVTGRLIKSGDPSVHPGVRYEGSTLRFSLAWTEP